MPGTSRRRRLPPKPEVPLQNCFTTLQTEERLITSGETLELSKVAQSAPCISIRKTKKRWWVIAVGNSLPRGSESSFANLTYSLEMCTAYWGFLYHGCHRETTKPSTVHWHPLLLFHMGTSDTARSRLRSMKKHYRALRAVVRGFGLQVVFFIDTPDPSEEILKGQLNLAYQQMVTELVPLPGVWLLRPWGLL